jgi:hypothetical protein
MMIAIDCRLTPDELDEVEARLNAIWRRLEREDKDMSVYRRAALAKAIDLTVAARRGIWDAQQVDAWAKRNSKPLIAAKQDR